METDTTTNGTFHVDHVPTGTLVRATAELHDFFMAAGLRGDIAPLLPIDKDHPTTTIAIAIARGEFALDEFEPDNTIDEVSSRPSVTLRTSYPHSLFSKADVDLSPLDVTAGTIYRIVVTPGETGPDDLGLALLNDAGTVVAHANDTPAEFMTVPSLTWKAPQDGRFYIQVGRSDDERASAPYTLTIDLTN
jgi:hypothetical protein